MSLPTTCTNEEITLQQVRRIHHRKRSRSLKAFLFLLPVLLSMGIFKYIPFLTAIVESFYEWNGANVNRFVGLKNFILLFGDPTFYVSLKNIALFTISYVWIQLIFPLLAAVAVYRIAKKKVQEAYKFLFLVPLVVPHIIIYLMWRWIYKGDGVLNKLLEAIGLSSWTHGWLGESTTSLWAIVFVGFPWIGGIYFLIYLAGLMAIPKELFEVGALDGMKSWQRLWFIEVPLIRNQIRLVFVLAFINQFQSFENVLVLTNGGPGFSTLTPALYLYKKGFEYNEFGYASAIGVVVFIILVLFTILSNKVIKPADKTE